MSDIEPRRITDEDVISPTEDILEDARAGRMFVLIDEEDRENEGDLVIPAEFADAEAINFMAKHGRGLICLAMTRSRCDQLGLKLMSPENRSRLQTAFTASIEAADGVTTGISAHDRARTVEVAIDPRCGAADLVSPGHIFPLVARDGGVLVRTGHTEAAVDIARMAGLNPSGVICEIMNDDGTMARLPDLIAFAQRHGLKIGAITDLIAFRRRHDVFVERRAENTIDSEWGGEWRLVVYRNRVDGGEHVALVRGEPSPDAPALVRVHKVEFASDLLGGAGRRSALIERAMRTISAHDGPGVIVFIRETSPTALAESFGASSPSHDEAADRALREYGVGAQILIDLGVREMTLLTTARRRVVGLDGYNLRITGTQVLGEGDDDA